MSAKPKISDTLFYVLFLGVAKQSGQIEVDENGMDRVLHASARLLGLDKVSKYSKAEAYAILDLAVWLAEEARV